MGAVQVLVDQWLHRLKNTKKQLLHRQAYHSHTFWNSVQWQCMLKWSYLLQKCFFSCLQTGCNISTFWKELKVYVYTQLPLITIFITDTCNFQSNFCLFCLVVSCKVIIYSRCKQEIGLKWNDTWDFKMLFTLPFKVSCTCMSHSVSLKLFSNDCWKDNSNGN